jgi:hypothetical protein
MLLLMITSLPVTASEFGPAPPLPVCAAFRPPLTSVATVSGLAEGRRQGYCCFLVHCLFLGRRCSLTVKLNFLLLLWKK